MKRRGPLLLALAVAVVGLAAVALALVLARDDGETGADAQSPVAGTYVWDGPAAASPAAQTASEEQTIDEFSAQDFVEATEPEPNPDRGTSDDPGVLPAPPEGGSTEPIDPSSPGASTASGGARRACPPKQVPGRLGYPYVRYCAGADVSRSPERAVGVLYFRKPDGWYRCTASAAGTATQDEEGNQSVLVTAAHCIGDVDPDTGRYVSYTDFLWFPEQDHRRMAGRLARAKTYEQYDRLIQRFARTVGWKARVNQNGRPLADVVPAWKRGRFWWPDFGVVIMSEKNGTTISVARTGLGVDMNGTTEVAIRSFGNPVGAPFKGLRLYVCAGAAKRGNLEVAADIPGGGADRTRVQAVGCDMTGGSSGGPWLTFLPGRQFEHIISVNSHGFRVCSKEVRTNCVPKSDDNLMAGPILDGRHWDVFDSARRYGS